MRFFLFGKDRPAITWMDFGFPKIFRGGAHFVSVRLGRGVSSPSYEWQKNHEWLLITRVVNHWDDPPGTVARWKWNEGAFPHWQLNHQLPDLPRIGKQRSPIAVCCYVAIHHCFVGIFHSGAFVGGFLCIPTSEGWNPTWQSVKSTIDSYGLIEKGTPWNPIFFDGEKTMVKTW